MWTLRHVKSQTPAAHKDVGLRNNFARVQLPA